jgi:hypothetical protein
LAKLPQHQCKLGFWGCGSEHLQLQEMLDQLWLKLLDDLGDQHLGNLMGVFVAMQMWLNLRSVAQLRMLQCNVRKNALLQHQWDEKSISWIKNKRLCD